MKQSVCSVGRFATDCELCRARLMQRAHCKNAAPKQHPSLELPDPWRRCPHNHLQYIARGIYAPQIAWWFQLFDPAQFLFINAHDLFNVGQNIIVLGMLIIVIPSCFFMILITTL